MHAWVKLAAVVTMLSVSGCTTGAAATSDRTDDKPRSPSTVDVPEARSGDLGIEDLPEPHKLGAGWEYRVDLGNPEDGYRGSGEPATARDPASVLAAIAPLGCRPVRLPMPSRALEVTYTRGEQPAVGLALRFSDESAARQFFDGHAAVVRQCTTSRRIDVTVERDTDWLFVSTRTEQLGETPSWTEGMRISASEVMLVAVAETSRKNVQAVLSALA